MQKRKKHSPGQPSITENENGAVIVAALMILVLLTIIGIASTNISNTEIAISTNEVIYQQNFYRAEGSTMEAIEAMEGIADPKDTAPSWLENNLGAVSDTDIQDEDFWAGAGSVVPETATLSDSQFVVVSEGIAQGESLESTSAKRHAYAIYGRSAPEQRGATVIQIGYLKAF